MLKRYALFYRLMEIKKGIIIYSRVHLLSFIARSILFFSIVSYFIDQAPHKNKRRWKSMG